MRRFRIALLFAAVLVRATCAAQTNHAPLVRIDSRDYGSTNRMAKAAELERNANTSKIKVVQERSSSVGESMFVVMAFYEVAKARNYEYFINLKEWRDKDGGQVYIAGFTNTRDADLKSEFGDEYAYENEFGQKRGYMSVSQFKQLFERSKKGVEPSAPANGASPRR
jgi:hypothetical protein